MSRRARDTSAARRAARRGHGRRRGGGGFRALEGLVPGPLEAAAELVQLALPRPAGRAAQAGGAAGVGEHVGVVEGAGVLGHVPAHAYRLDVARGGKRSAVWGWGYGDQHLAWLNLRSETRPELQEGDVIVRSKPHR